MVPSPSPDMLAQGSEPTFTTAMVRMQMERILNCRLFRASPRLTGFLRFTVEQTLLGRQAFLKEYMIGVEVFGKPETFDPRLDSIVRVEARRLRAKIALYYQTDGKQDAVLIQYRPGQYVPQFGMRGEDQEDVSKMLLVVPDGEASATLMRNLQQLGYAVRSVSTSSPDWQTVLNSDGHAELTLLRLCAQNQQ